MFFTILCEGQKWPTSVTFHSVQSTVISQTMFLFPPIHFNKSLLYMNSAVFEVHRGFRTFLESCEAKSRKHGYGLQWPSLKHRKTGLYFYSTRRRGLFRFIMALTTVHKYYILTERQTNSSNTSVVLSLFCRDPHNACFHWNCRAICCFIQGAMTLRLRTTGLRHSKNNQGKVVCGIKSKCSNSPTA